MKQTFCAILMIIFIISLSGCSSTSKRPEFRREAIRLTLTADPMLNLYEESPHTLLVCIYELLDPNAFNHLMDQVDGLTKLMECNRFDASVAYAKRVVLQPASEVREILDRAEGARYLAISAGYYHVQKDRPFALYKLASRTTKINVNLGPQGIQDTGR